jgi:mevalonate kinase
MTKSSAPGKIILFGEHAVVYGRPALAVPVTQVHADVEITDISPLGGSDSAGIWIQAPDIDLHAELNTLPSDHPIASVIHNLFFLSRISPFPKLNIKITSTIPVASGLGSGAAVTVALTTVHPQASTTPSSHTPSRFTSSKVKRLKHSKSVSLLPLSSAIPASAHRLKNLWAMYASYGKRIKQNGEVCLMK